jgi:hypothetical protein
VNIKAVAVCALVMLSTPAAAQGWGRYGPVFDYQEIRASLRAHGLRPISQPVLSGRYVVIRAIDRYGEPMRVLMSARYGDVIEVTPLPPARVARAWEPRPFRPYVVYPARRYEALEPRTGAVRPDLKDMPAGPPAAAHDGYAAVPNPPPRSAALTLGRTPTPRPRPAAAGATAAVTPAPAATESKPAPAAAAPKPATTAAKQSPPAAAAAPAAPEVTGSIPPKPAGQAFPAPAPLE